MAKLQRLYSQMDWWEVAEQPTKHKKIEKFIHDCKQNWDCGGEKSTHAIKKLEHHLRAAFIVENVRNWEELFDEVALKGNLEIQANKIKLLDVDFSAEPLPLCKSGASFLLPTRSNFYKIDLDQWQEKNGHLHDAISFYWDLSDIEEIDLDLTFGSHSGVECVLDD